VTQAYDYLARGDTEGAVKAASAALRDQPLDLSTRLLLIDLFCINADWDRAARQTDVLESLNLVPAGVPESYRLLCRAERQRAEFAATGAPAPVWMVEPPGWAADHFAGLERLRAGSPDEAKLLLDRSEAARPDVTGRLGDRAFEGFRDLDDALGPLLEVVTQQGLTYAAWEDVRYLDVAPPAAARDFLWAPARLALKQGPIGKVYLPALYLGSAAGPDGTVRLGRETRWRDLGGGLAAGLGLKMFLTGDDAVSLFELRVA